MVEIANVNIGAEQHLLGSIVLESENYEKIYSIVKHCFFYEPKHQEVFKAIELTYFDRRPIDLVTVSERLKSSKAISGSPSAFISDLCRIVVSPKNAIDHAKIVAENFYKRELVSINRSIDEALKNDADTDGLEKQRKSVMKSLKSIHSHHGQVRVSLDLSDLKTLRTHEQIAKYIERNYSIKYMGGSIYVYDETHGLWEKKEDKEFDQITVSILEKIPQFPIRLNFINEVRGLIQISRFCQVITSDRRYVNFKNCLWDIDGRKTIEHTPDIFTAYQMNFDFPITGNLKGAKFDPQLMAKIGPETLKFINSVSKSDPTMMVLFQQMFGYCMTADTRYQVAFFLHGPGSNGKSVMLKMLESLLGKTNISSISFHQLQEIDRRSDLINKLANISTEIDSKSISSMEAFKQITTGDSISAKFLYKDIFSFKPFCKLIFSCNEFPVMNERTYALHRRIIMLPFDAIYEGKDIDHNLEGKLLLELQAIAYWAVFGWYSLIDNGGFITNARCEERKQMFLDQTSPVLKFAYDRLVLHPDCNTDSNLMYLEYSNWMTRNGYHKMNRGNFESELLRSFREISIIRKNNHHYFIGARMADDEPVILTKPKYESSGANLIFNTFN